MKRCVACKEEKPLDQFRRMAKAKDGLQAQCASCAREYYYQNRERIRPQIKEQSRLRRDAGLDVLYDYLSTHPCVDCEEADILVLDLDHVTDDKRMDVTRMVHDGHSAKKIQEEIDKCEVRCANCHRRKTAQRSVELGNRHRRWEAAMRLELDGTAVSF